MYFPSILLRLAGCPQSGQNLELISVLQFLQFILVVKYFVRSSVYGRFGKIAANVLGIAEGGGF
jgi:hypothetical protein